MARYTGPKHKLSRREGVNLFGSTSRSLERRLSVPPGMHGRRRGRKPSEYALQLREKQKVKRLFGMLEKQFRRFYEMAARQRGATGQILLQVLERRLDNVVYRIGFGRTRMMARQLVSHGHVRVNGQEVNIPSYLVKAGDTITLTPSALQNPEVQAALEERGGNLPAWLEMHDGVARVVRLPEPGESEPGINPELIVEFYSR